MDEELIYRNLKKMNHKEDRSVYRDISKVFHEVIQYNKNMMEELTNRIDQEKTDQFEKLYIYGTVAEGAESSLADHFFFPMSCEDEMEAGYLTTLFFEYSEPEMNELYGKSYIATIETDGGSLERVVKVIASARYIAQVDALKRQFYSNKICFGNVNLPYIYKFADVILEDEEELGEIQKVTLAGYEEIAREGMVPLWNVKELELPCAMFPEPAVDQIYFEHMITMPNPDDGYVVKEDPEIARVFLRDDTIVIWTERELSKQWGVYRIVSPANKNISIPHFKITTNQRNMTHSDRQAESAVRMPRTKGELIRILNSYELTKEIGFCEDIPDAACSNAEGRPVIQIKFKPPRIDFITKEEVDFLLRELKFYFPEYQFEGELC